MTAPALLDPALTAGTRTQITVVGVDAGTMCLGTSFPDEGEWMDGPRQPGAHGWSGPGWACSSSGYGDGGYGVVAVHDNQGTRTGVVVVFLFPEAEAAAQEQMLHTQFKMPTDEQQHAVWDRTADDATKALYAKWDEESNKTLMQVWDAMLPGHDPAEGSTPEVVTDLTVTDGELYAGDPCYDGPSATITVPNGTYRVVAWVRDAGDWGSRVARLGAYRLP